jgi:V/A-type H+-transporting ATPase subunit I
MFRTAWMVRVTAGVHAERREEMIAALHEAGVIELQAITDIEELQALIAPGSRSASVPEIAEARSRIERAVEILDSVVPEPNPIVELFGRPPKQKASFPVVDASSVLAEAERFSDPVSAVLALHTREIAIIERMARLDEEEQMLRLLLPFGIEPGWLKNSSLLEVRAGILPDGECADIEAHLREKVPDLAVVEMVCGVGDHPTTVVAIAHPDAAQELDVVLRSLAFHEFNPETGEGSAEGGLAAVTEERGRLAGERKEIHTSLVAIAQTHLEPLRAMAEELAVMRDREDAAPLFGETETITVVQGWAREKDMPKVRELCDASSGGLSFCTTTPVSGNVPVAFDHPRWLAPYGFLTAMFGMPEYRNVDPTIFLAPVLIITFGLMLGDAGYGILLALIAALLLRGAGHTPGTVRDLASVLVACGIAGTIFGLLMGSFFGDLLPRIFGETLPFTLIEPLKDPLTILIIALSIGIAHLNLGLSLAAHEHLREGKRREMLMEEGTWFCLQPCAAVLILSFFGWGAFSSTVMMAAWAGAAVSIAGIMLDKGPLGFFSITGYLGDWLSYARILALALATGGIAMMINILSGMIAGIGPVFVIVGILFAVAGHAANLVLQSLGGFIHALRLQYVEFFGRFFHAGGRAFSPFAARRTVTEWKGGNR